MWVSSAAFQDHSNRRIVLIGAYAQADPKGINKQHILFSRGLEKWISKTQGRLRVIGEYGDRKQNIDEADSGLKTLCERAINECRDRLSEASHEFVCLCDCWPLIGVGNLTFRSIKFWQPLGTELTQDQEQEASRLFLKSCENIDGTFSDVFRKVDETLEEAGVAVATLVGGTHSAAVKMIQDRIDAVGRSCSNNRYTTIKYVVKLY